MDTGCYRLWTLSKCLHRNGRTRAAELVRRWLRLMYACDLPPEIEMDFRVGLVHNGLGVVINRQTVFQGYAVVFQNVTIGDRALGERVEGPEAPVIGNRVFIGAGACVLAVSKLAITSSLGRVSLSRDLRDHSHERSPLIRRVVWIVRNNWRLVKKHGETIAREFGATNLTAYIVRFAAWRVPHEIVLPPLMIAKRRLMRRGQPA
jgi:serine O-acetyltransferase